LSFDTITGILFSIAIANGRPFPRSTPSSSATSTLIQPPNSLFLLLDPSIPVFRIRGGIENVLTYEGGRWMEVGEKLNKTVKGSVRKGEQLNILLTRPEV